MSHPDALTAALDRLETFVANTPPEHLWPGLPSSRRPFSADDLRGDVIAVLGALARAREDSALLDWIETEAARRGHGSLNSVRLSPALDEFPAECEVNRYARFSAGDDVQTFTGATVREALAAARAATPATSPPEDA